MAGANSKRKTPYVAGSSKGTRGGGRKKKIGGGSRGRAAPRARVSEPLIVEENVGDENLNEEILGEQETDPPRQRPVGNELQRFIDNKAISYFNNRFRIKPALIERSVEQSKVKPEFWQNIQNRGWGKLLTVNKQPPNLSLLREFVSNAKVAGHASDHIFLRGSFLDVSRESIAKHFGFPTIESNSEYNQVLTRLSNQDPPVDVLETMKQAICPGCDWIASKTDPRHAISTTPWTHHQKLVVKFVTSRLYPTSKSSEISIALLKIVYAILHNIPIDAAKIIKDKLIAFLEKPSPNLIFPHMITDMAKTIGVNKLDGDILAYRNPPPLVEVSNFARHGAHHQPQQQAPPPPRQPNRAARSILEQVHASALASQQDWFNDNRRAMLSLRAIKDKEARQRNISTAHLPNISEQPYEYDPMVQQYIRDFSQPFVGGESSTRNEAGGVGQGGVEGSGGGDNDFDDLDMMDVLGTDLDTEIGDTNGTEGMESRQPKPGKGKGLATSFPDTRFTEADPSETDDDLT